MIIYKIRNKLTDKHVRLGIKKRTTWLKYPKDAIELSDEIKNNPSNFVIEMYSAILVDSKPIKI